MKLKTYTASTMAQALAQVRKDLGTEAMILHTRSYRTGSWLGLGGKPMVEITASSAQPTKSRKTRRAQRPAAPSQVLEETQSLTEQPIPEIVVQRGRVQESVAAPTQHTRVAATTNDRDDRAELLQGLLGGQRQEVRSRHKIQPSAPEPLQEPAVVANQTQVQHQAEEPVINEDFVATTFPSIDRSSQPEQEQPIVPEPAPLIDSHSEDVFERVIQEPTKPVHNEESLEEALLPARGSESDNLSDPVSDPIKAQADDADVVAETPQEQAAGENAALKEQIESLQRMMGQVLDSTRRTAVVVGRNDSEGALPSPAMSAPLHAFYTEMIDNDVPLDLADRFAGAVRDRLDPDELNDKTVVRHALLQEIESTIQTASKSSLISDTVSTDVHSQRPRVIALIGPTGVGKTTTVAKLAATAKLKHGKSVALITSDTYRIAAVEQLKTYASIIGLQLRIANTPEEMQSVIAELHGTDLIVIDTAGRSQNNHARLDELGELIKSAAPDETHLVLSSTVGENVLRKTAARFKDLGPDRCILTKLDEAVCTGMIAGMTERIGLPLSFVTVGQEVPDDMLLARADRLARAVLDGPSAVVPQL